MTDVPCPDCSGGKYMQVIDWPGVRLLPCSTCSGKGTITEAHWGYIEVGRQLRAYRLTLNHTQREFAKAHDIDFVILSKLENGYPDAWELYPDFANRILTGQD